jgi:hypothetical protein
VRRVHVADEGVMALHDDLAAARQLEVPEPFHAVRLRRGRSCGGVHSISFRIKQFKTRDR